MQTILFNDADAITAHYLIGERQRASYRAAAFSDARNDHRTHRAYLSGVGNLLIRLGERLQAMAHQPAGMKETVQW